MHIGVVHWRAPHWAAETVASLRTTEGFARVHVTVYDNSPDGPDAYVPGQGEDLVVRGSNLGYAGAANAMIEHWRSLDPVADVMVIASHDATVHAATLATMVAVLLAEPRAGIVGIDFGASDVEPSVPTSVDLTVIDRLWVSGTLMVLRPACIEAVGGFDSTLHSYVEDVDLCVRAHEGGFGVTTVESVSVRWRGSRAEDRFMLTEANWMLLAHRRRGVRGSGAIALSLLRQLVRSAAGSALPWRARRQRDDSRRRVRQLFGALRRGTGAIRADRRAVRAPQG